jgi:hypothetical protein
MGVVIQEAAEWLDKEPHKDGKPCRWNPIRELPTYRPLFWFELPEGAKREALRLEQEKPGYKYFNR